MSALATPGPHTLPEESLYSLPLNPRQRRRGLGLTGALEPAAHLIGDVERTDHHTVDVAPRRRDRRIGQLDDVLRALQDADRKRRPQEVAIEPAALRNLARAELLHCSPCREIGRDTHQEL